MVTVIGSATTGYSHNGSLGLPRPPTGGRRPAHPPWCVDCKKRDRPLDEEQRCGRCARAAEIRARAAEQRLERAVAERQAGLEAHRPVALTPDPKVPASAPRRKPGPPRLQLPAQEVIAAYQGGQTLGEIAAAHGCSHPTIARLLDAHGVKRRGAPVPRSQELLAEVRRLYLEEGLTQTEVAACIGHSTKVVQNVMAELGLEARPSASARSMQGIGHPIKIAPAEHAAIVERYTAGESAPSIARTYDVVPASIYHILQRAGVTDRHANRTLAGPGKDRAAPLRARMAELGVTSRQVKEWAHEHGLVPRITRGLPARDLIEQYAAEHEKVEG